MIRLTKQAHSLHRLELDDITIWFSYETPVAFEITGNNVRCNNCMKQYKDKDLLTCENCNTDEYLMDTPYGFKITKNIWSSTTGKHLNMINSDRSIRIEFDEFIKLLTEALE